MNCEDCAKTASQTIFKREDILQFEEMVIEAFAKMCIGATPEYTAFVRSGPGRTPLGREHACYRDKAQRGL